MIMRFTKMQGLGNDFVVIDAVQQAITFTSELIKAIADRHCGVGCDQVLVLTKATDARADFGYRIFNADGGEVFQCGNGARCMGLFIKHHKLSNKNRFCLQTQRDFLTVEWLSAGDVQVDIAKPQFQPAAIPFITTEKKIPYAITLRDRVIECHVVNVGNPHCVIRVDAISVADANAIGEQLNQHAAFPEGVNVGLMRCVSRDEIALCVYERGAGLTRACGSGACAAVAVGRQAGWLDTVVRVQQAGGELQVSWHSPEAMIQLRGPATLVFEGIWGEQTDPR